MNAHLWFETIGYAGSILVAISLMMKSLLRLRIINLVGALMFTIYGFLIGAEPVAVLNGLIVCIDLYYLNQMLRQKDYFTLLEVSHDSEYLRGFVNFYKNEISEIYSGYAHKPDETQLNFFVLRNMVPAGILIVQADRDQARVLLDYVIPGYRDFRVGKYLFEENAAYFVKRGIHRFISEPGRARHAQYLERMGFQRSGEDYIRELSGQALRDAHI
jgi:GNAT superfamily N-acetyltransferase